MKKKRRSPIQGSQPTPTPPPLDPNDLAPECILVDKVYDWVFFANEYKNKNMIPDTDCQTAVSDALAAGDTLTTECTTGDPDDVDVDVTILENGNPGRVRLVWTVTVTVTVFANGEELCNFDVVTQFDDEIMLCVPEGITEENINVRATQVICRTDGVLMGSAPLGPMIPVKVVLCKDIQVEYPVKLEVLAKFCFPRPNNIKVPKEVVQCDLDALEFPPQCPGIFPVDNCECQATALARNEDTIATFGSDGTMITGLSTLNAQICQECALGDSQFSYSFTDSDTSDGDLSFTFSPKGVDRVECVEAIDMLIATGQGVRYNAGKPESVSYELQISDSGSFRLTLSNSAGNQVFDSGVVTALVDYRECETFADLLNDDE